VRPDGGIEPGAGPLCSSCVEGEDIEDKEEAEDILVRPGWPDGWSEFMRIREVFPDICNGAKDSVVMRPP